MRLDKEKSPPNPLAWNNNRSASIELMNQHEPVDYSKIIVGARVLFFAEYHPNSPIREHIACYAAKLKAAGITHLAIEFPKTEQNLGRLMNLPKRLSQGKVDLSWLNRECPAISEDRRNYDVVVRELAMVGIEVIPVDIVQDRSKTREQREESIAANIQEVLEKDPYVKMAVLIGSFHTLKTYVSPESGLSANGRLIQQQVPTVAVQFVGGYGKIPTSVIDAAKQVNLADQEWMMDMIAYIGSQSVPFGAGQTDVMIHLPQRESLSTGSDLGTILFIL